VVIYGIEAGMAPAWNIHMIYSDNVVTAGCYIHSEEVNNGDGWDPDSSTNCTLFDCDFKTRDDMVAIKSGKNPEGNVINRPSYNIRVFDCRCTMGHGLAIGSEMSGGASNVYMENVEIGTVKNAIYFKSNKDRGGYIRNVNVNNITVERARGAILRFETNYFGFRGGNYPAIYEDFVIENVQAKRADNYALFMEGNPERKIRNIRIENFHTEDAEHPFHMLLTQDVTLTDCSINGEALPTTLPEDSEKIVLDVY
jgi:polygalacturonase